MKYMCPVCGYHMEDPPRDYNICPSCGTEFGSAAASRGYDVLRAEWLRTGPRWWSLSEPAPANWNPFEQVARIGVTA
jgi:hypothetical protein